MVAHRNSADSKLFLAIEPREGEMPDPTPRPGGPRVPIPAPQPTVRTNDTPRFGGHRGNMATLCALKHLAMARYRRYALSDAWQWQDFAAMRSRAAIRGNFFAPCIPEGAPDGKSAPPWQDSRAMHPKRAGFGKICAPCIRKAPQIAFQEYTARRSRQEGAPFAALTPRIMHGARILPSDVDEPPWRSQPLCRRTARAARNHGAALMARQPSERATRHNAKPPEHSQPRCRRTAPSRPQPLRRSATREPTAWIGCTMLDGFARIARAGRDRAELKMPTF